MLDPDGNVFDCMGRYTNEEIQEKFGGKNAIKSLAKTQTKTERYNTLNLAQTQAASHQLESPPRAVRTLHMKMPDLHSKLNPDKYLSSPQPSSTSRLRHARRSE